MSRASTEISFLSIEGRRTRLLSSAEAAILILVTDRWISFDWCRYVYVDSRCATQKVGPALKAQSGYKGGKLLRFQTFYLMHWPVH